MLPSSAQDLAPAVARDPARVRRVLLACGVAGLVAEALFHGAGGRVGVNFTLLVAVFAAIHTAFAGHDAPLTRRIAAASVPIVASAPVFLLDSQWSRFFAVPMSLSWLLLVPRFVERGASLAVFGRVPERAAEAVVRLVPALARSLRLPVDSLRLRGGDDVGRTMVWAALLGLPAVVVFVALFSFDERFAGALSAGLRRGDDALSFAVAALGFALLAALLVGLEELRPRRAPGAIASAPDAPYRVPPREEPAPGSEALAAKPFRPPPTAFALVLGQVALVFTLYVGLHVRELFTSHAFVRTTQGVTYAGQVHSGFFAVLVASGLALGLVLASHALFAETRNQMSARETTTLRAAELALLTLTLPALASCAQKLALYIEAYGETYLRLGVGLAIVTVLPLILLAGWQSIRPMWTGFGAAAALVFFTAGTAASYFDADAHVARVNVERALRGAPFDDEYLSTLGPRTLVGLAGVMRHGSDDETRYRAFAGPIAGARATADGSVRPTIRGYRRGVRCLDLLDEALCATPPSGADLAPTRTER